MVSADPAPSATHPGSDGRPRTLRDTHAALTAASHTPSTANLADDRVKAVSSTRTC